jgi:hypothetical protein
MCEGDGGGCRVVGVGESGAFHSMDAPNRRAHSVLSDGISIAHHVSALRRRDFAGERMEMPLRIHIGIASLEALPDLRFGAAHGPVQFVRGDRTVAGIMRLTDRDMELLTLLRSARWLTTSQVHRRHFAKATLGAARRRLRVLSAAGYARKEQQNPMQEALFTLGRESRRVVERGAAKEIVIERNPPKQLEHLIGINDVRIAAELTPELSYFFAAWELPATGWKHCIVPDAVFRIGQYTFALEYDRGLENLRYFVGSKVAAYRRGLPGLPLAGVLIAVDSESRRRTLARAIGRDPRVVIALLGVIRKEGLLDVVEKTYPLDPSSRENRFSSASTLISAS